MDAQDPPEEAALLAAVLDVAVDAIIVADEDGVILRANAAAAALFGHERERMVGRGVDMLMPPDHARRHGTYMGRHLRTGERRIIGIGRDLEGLRRDGSVFPLHLSVGRADGPGRPSFIAILRDLTAQKAAEAALASSEQMDAIGRMTGGIAHDFNNLQAIVLGNLELLEPALDDGDQRLLARDAIEAAELGADLTARMLLFARRGTLSPERLRPAEVVEEALAILRRTLGGGFEIEARGAVQAELALDWARLGSAIVNLVLNARDAMPSGGRIAVEMAEVMMGPDRPAEEIEVPPGRHLRIAVVDLGEGMDAATRARALEPFFTTKAAGEGTGFGLPMVYGFVRQSGGHLTLRSAPGRGTTVALYFPLPDMAGAPDAGPEAGGSAAAPRGRGERVLVVEDDPPVRRTSIARLASLGYVAEGAASGEAALRRLAAGPLPDLVFSDVVMGTGMSGLDLARELAASHPGLPVLLTSGYAAALDAPDAPDVLRKPYATGRLAARLRSALDAPGSQDAPARSTSDASE